MSKFWHTADPHFGHTKVAMYRGFFTPEGEVDVAAHDAEVYHSIARQLSPGDTVRWYGDLAIDGEWREALQVVKQLKQEQPDLRFELLYGNHDPIHPMHRLKSLDTYEEYAEVFDWMGERLWNKSDYGRSVYFSHFPAVNGDDRHSDKFKLWQIPGDLLNFEGDKHSTDWVIHGHTHQVTMYNDTRPNHLCVSWDVLRGPVSDETLKKGILRQLGKKRLYQPVHWGEWEQYHEKSVALIAASKAQDVKRTVD